MFLVSYFHTLSPVFSRSRSLLLSRNHTFILSFSYSVSRCHFSFLLLELSLFSFLDHSLSQFRSQVLMFSLSRILRICAFTFSHFHIITFSRFSPLRYHVFGLSHFHSLTLLLLRFYVLAHSCTCVHTFLLSHCQSLAFLHFRVLILLRYYTLVFSYFFAF